MKKSHVPKKALVALSSSTLAAGMAHGAIIYTYYNTTVVPGASYSFDLNQDGSADYTLEWNDNNALKPYINDSVGLSGPTQAFVLSDSTDDNGNSAQGLPLTTNGTSIDGDYESPQQDGYFVQDPNAIPIGGWLSNGTNVDGYVGLELQDAGGSTHYGWAQFIYNSDGIAGQLTLVDCAMETQTNTTILAGQTAEAGTAPSIVISPSSQTAGIQETVQLTVIGTGNPAPAYQWMAGAVGKGVYTNLTDGGHIVGSTSNILTISDLTAANAADYVVKLSNSNGLTTNLPPATLTVAPLTINSLTPLSFSLYDGEKASINVSYASSAPISSFQWQKNGANLSNGGNISGATSSNLVVSSLSASDSANYSVVLANTYGAITSRVDSVSVVAPVLPYEQEVTALHPVAYYNFNETNNPVSSTNVLALEGLTADSDTLAYLSTPNTDYVSETNTITNGLLPAPTNTAIAFDRIGGFNGIYGIDTENGNPNYGITGPLPSEGLNGFSPTNTAVAIVSQLVQPSSIVSIPPLNLNTNTVTFTAWINPQTTEPDYAAIVSIRSPVSGLASEFSYGPYGGLSYDWNDNTNTSDYDSGITPPAGQWSFVALTISPTNAVIYLFNADGISSATNELSAPGQPANTPGYIGGDNYNPNFIGDIDEVAIFNQVLSENQLADLYSMAVTGTLPATNVHLSIQSSGGNLIITWNPAVGILLQSTSLTGPWTSDALATSPYTVTPTGAQMFYRIQVQ